MVALDTPLGELALGAVRQQASIFLEHAPALRSTHDPREVHQTRVATRRLRAGLRLFADILPADAPALNAELKWMAGLLGAIRDLDVHEADVRSRANELDTLPPLEPYLAWLGAERQRARRALLNAFDNQQYAALAEHLQQAIDTWPLPADDPPASDAAPERIQAVYARLRKKARAAEKDAPPVAFHQVRIRAKRLRYTVEFFEPVYGRPATAVVKRSVELQDVLGGVQDGVVGSARLQQALQVAGPAWEPATAFALGRLVQAYTQQGETLRRGFPDCYRRLRKAWRRLGQEF